MNKVFGKLRGSVGKFFTPIAKTLLKWGVSPDAVTLAGTIIVVAIALICFPNGWLWQGAALIGIFVFTDAIDGTMARLSGRSSKWGAFLDSSLDRIADAAVFSGITIYFWLHTDGIVQSLGVLLALSSLVLSMLISYTRARAEGLGFTANVGIMERTERLVLSLVAAGFVGFGLTIWVLIAVLAILVLGCLVTVYQRMRTVYLQDKSASGLTEPKLDEA